MLWFRVRCWRLIRWMIQRLLQLLALRRAVYNLGWPARLSFQTCWPMTIAGEAAGRRLVRGSFGAPGEKDNADRVRHAIAMHVCLVFEVPTLG